MIGKLGLRSGLWGSGAFGGKGGVDLKAPRGVEPL